MEEGEVNPTTEALAGIMIQLARIYDLLVVGLPEEYREKILKLHSEGNLLSTAPFLNEETFGEWNGEE